MKKYIISLFIILYSLFTPQIIFAEYVLPYPSFMPGNKIYKITRIIDSLKNYWYFGNIAQEKYHLALADKYLVEAKTLFEYKQYLLGQDAIDRSDSQIRSASISFEKGLKSTEDLSGQLKIFCNALSAHNEVLATTSKSTPEKYIWEDEKKEPVSLNLASRLQHSMGIRTDLIRKYACDR